MRRTYAFRTLLSLATTTLLGCPESETLTPLLADIVDSPSDTTTSADLSGGDGSGSDGVDGAVPDVTPDPSDIGDAGEMTADTDTTVVPDVPDTAVPPECTIDADCIAVLGGLGPCEIPLCEDGECFADGVPNGAECNDGDICTVSDRCAQGACIGTALDCSDDNACTSDECDAFSGTCVNAPLEDAPCDDGDVCSGPDVCADGVCTSTPSECPSCTVDEDCKGLDDGNACNGTVGCNAGTCGLVPGSVVDCSQVILESCKSAACNPTSGACELVAGPDGTPCEPSSPCQAAGICAGGKCQGPAIVCDDGNPCTTDVCDTATGCVSKPESGASCDDGDPCTSKDACKNGVCSGAAIVDCDDDNPCTIDACDPVTKTCTNTPTSGACSDGDACTTDACTGGKCVSTPIVCDDGDACTTESCSPATGCASFDVVCDDGSVCTADSCLGGKCVGQALTCDDQNACTKDTCDPVSGCKYAPLTCNDGDVCTTDACDPKTGCKSTAPAGACKVDSDCADTDPCTINTCTGPCGTCQVAPLPCFDGDPCTDDACLAGVGCSFTPGTGAACDDGDKCTGNDTCFVGACVGGPVVCPLGSIDNPAPSCLSIKQTQPASTDGKYWLSTPSSGAPFEAYCDMTTQGGGFTRIAVVGADIALCSYATGVGTTDQVANGSATTAIWPSDLAGDLPFVYREILLNTTSGLWVFTSGNASFTWNNVANGTINSANIGSYQVSSTKNGTGNQTLQSTPVGPGLKGAALLGGKLTSGFTPFFGVGAQQTGTFVQNAACVLAATKGIYTTSWGQKGTILIR
jgi:hypothetical protein